MINQVYTGLVSEQAGKDAKSVEAFYKEYGQPSVFDRFMTFVESVRNRLKAALDEEARRATAPVRGRPAVRPVRRTRVRPVRPASIASA